MTDDGLGYAMPVRTGDRRRAGGSRRDTVMDAIADDDRPAVRGALLRRPADAA